VLLLDEIEKANQDVFNLLLQVMDHGKLTDNNGKSVDFRNIILIMTTNAGASELHKQGIGFGRGIKSDEDQEAINRLFTPEFRNRLDSIIAFSALETEIVARVVDKFILQLEAQLQDRNVSIQMSDEARAWVAQKGFDKLFGARPMARFIQENVKKPLAEELLFGKLEKGGHVVITLKDDKLAFTLTADALPKKPDPEEDDAGEDKVPALVH
jgi:ATP-dependent Clp protease ATP-binding subunit ClpA